MLGGIRDAKSNAGTDVAAILVTMLGGSDSTTCGAPGQSGPGGQPCDVQSRWQSQLHSAHSSVPPNAEAASSVTPLHAKMRATTVIARMNRSNGSRPDTM